MTFLDCVNRILRIEGFIRGDSDPLSSFTDTAHSSSSSLAQIAIQDEISELSSRGLLPYQHVEDATITLVAAQRKYNLPANFVQMWGEPAFFFDVLSNNQILEYQGGENRLRNDIQTYKTDPGYPMWYYFPLGTTRTVAFYPVPDTARAGFVFDYDYSGSANVAVETDTIPLTTTDQQYAFADMAGRRFRYIYQGKRSEELDKDPMYMSARSRLFALLKNRQAATKYGSVYVAGPLERF